MEGGVGGDLRVRERAAAPRRPGSALDGLPPSSPHAPGQRQGAPGGPERRGSEQQGAAGDADRGTGGGAAEGWHGCCSCGSAGGGTLLCCCRENKCSGLAARFLMPPTCRDTPRQRQRRQRRRRALHKQQLHSRCASHIHLAGRPALQQQWRRWRRCLRMCCSTMGRKRAPMRPSCGGSCSTAPRDACELPPGRRGPATVMVSLQWTPAAQLAALSPPCSYVVGDDGVIKAADVRQQLLSGAWAEVSGGGGSRGAATWLACLPARSCIARPAALPSPSLTCCSSPAAAAAAPPPTRRPPCGCAPSPWRRRST